MNGFQRDIELAESVNGRVRPRHRMRMRCHRAARAPRLVRTMRSFVLFLTCLLSSTGAKAGSNTCWGRVYSASHLAAQPRQAVVAIHLWNDTGQRRHFETWPSDGKGDGDNAHPAPRRLYIRTRDEANLRGGDLACSPTGQAVSCTGLDGLSRDDRAPSVRLKRIDRSLQLELLADAWPLLTLEDHLTQPSGLAATPLRAGTSDHLFRLDPLPADACAAIEQTFARALTAPDNPPITRQIENARQQRPRDGGRICLSGRSAAGMELRLGFDAQAGDRSDPIDAFAFDVVQKRSAAPTQTAQSSLLCRARDYAWRCEWRLFDGQSRHAAIPFEAENGMLVRRPGGALLRGFPCLGGRCGDGIAAGPGDDIALRWADPSACDAPR